MYGSLRQMWWGSNDCMGTAGHDSPCRSSSRYAHEVWQTRQEPREHAPAPAVVHHDDDASRHSALLMSQTSSSPTTSTAKMSPWSNWPLPAFGKRMRPRVDCTP